MKSLIVLCGLILFINLFSCQDRSDLTEVQREEIIKNVKDMAERFFKELDALKIDEAMSRIDSAAVFNYITENIGSWQIARDDIASAYNNIDSLKSDWQSIDIEPFTPHLAYFQFSFNQDLTNIRGESGEIYGSISAIVGLRDNKWQFLKGQIYTKSRKKN